MKKILFVCHGNICRSTMAESIFTHLVREADMSGKFEIDSAAVSHDAIGKPPHRNTQSKLRENNIAVVEHKARHITADDMNSFDHIVCMDDSNLSILKRLFTKEDIFDKNKNKVSLLLDFTKDHIRREVADPWYTGDYEETFVDVMLGCKGLLSICK